LRRRFIQYDNILARYAKLSSGKKNRYEGINLVITINFLNYDIALLILLLLPQYFIFMSIGVKGTAIDSMPCIIFNRKDKTEGLARAYLFS